MGTYIRRGTYVSYKTGSRIGKNSTKNVRYESTKSRIEIATKLGSYDGEPSYHLNEVDLAEMFEDNGYKNRSFNYKQPLNKLRKQA